MTRLRKASTASLHGDCARRIREIAGFDRVMIYRFDADWNGAVIAEDRRDDLEPFLGLHYPASDIPRQARELYARNWLRFIADRDYAPVPILPPSGPDCGDSPLDLEPIGATERLARSIWNTSGTWEWGRRCRFPYLKGDRLWGLVACHHSFLAPLSRLMKPARRASSWARSCRCSLAPARRRMELSRVRRPHECGGPGDAHPPPRVAWRMWGSR